MPRKPRSKITEATAPERIAAEVKAADARIAKATQPRRATAGTAAKPRRTT
jgi:hypothetical protein